MAERKTLSSSLSARVVEYLRTQGRTQSEIARLLGVSEGFISLVKSRERSLTIDHLERVAETMGVPLGAFLLAATPQPTAGDGSKDLTRLYELTERLIRSADGVKEAIMRGGRSASA